MFSSQKKRDRSRSSQRTSFDLSSSRPAQVPSPGAGTKRLFSGRKPRLTHDSEHDEAVPADLPTIHCEKRHRSGNWPLPDSSPVGSSTSRHPLQNRNAPNSPKLQRPSPQKRPSKFVEGSMNDRASQMPDTAYLGIDQESLMETHAWEQATRPRPQSCVPTTSNTTAAGPSEASRHSSIFRFGRSIAATFNPSNWKMFGKQDRNEQQVAVEDPQQKILRERQEKAEKIYAELKQTGHFPTIRAQNLDLLLESKTDIKHDSGISVTDTWNPPTIRTSIDAERSMSKEDKRRGMIFLEPPSTTSTHQRGLSPSISNFSTPSRTSFQNLKRNSLSNIKKKFNYDNSNESRTEIDGIESSASRIPSRKDIQKQQKLVKRVSDLESKLESARRRLNESIGEPAPPKEQYNRGMRRKFIPGAMPTLPSERLLAGYVESDESSDSAIGRAMTEDIAVGARHSLDEPRGRSRSVRVPDISPSHFYPPPSPLTKDALLAQERVTKRTRLLKIKQESLNESDKATTDVSTKLSTIHSVYVDEGAEEESEAFSTVESTSVLTPSEEEDNDDFITPKAKGRKSNSTTPKKVDAVHSTPKVASPAGKLLQASKDKHVVRKRKILADDSGVYKPTAASMSGDSELEPVKKQVPKRKPAALQAKVLVKQSSPQRSLPPLPTDPKPPANARIDTFVSKGPAQKVAKISNASSPSAVIKDTSQTATAHAPVRSISRKAVPQSASSPGKPKLAPGIHPRARQSASPPPSAAFFDPQLDVKKAPAIIKQTPVDRSDDVVVKVDTQADEDRMEEVVSRRVRGRSAEIPPMPKLPRTVRLPSGEVVDVKVRAPIAGPRSSSRAASRTRSNITSNKLSTVNAPITLAKGSDDKTNSKMTVDDGNFPKKTVMKADTRESFEWPSDCF